MKQFERISKFIKTPLLFKAALVVVLLSAIVSGTASAAVPVYPSGMLAVHRFYNTKTLTHFYTPDEDEVVRVKNTLSDFKYEGIKFNAYSAPAPGRIAVHRFYNVKTLSHFYSSDQNEVNIIRSTLKDFNYEGISYYTDESTTRSTGHSVVYRFYNTKTLTHLYTSDENEVNTIRSRLPDYRYEGAKFGAAESRHFANCTEARLAGVAPILRGQVGYDTNLDRDNDGIACENSSSPSTTTKQVVTQRTIPFTAQTQNEVNLKRGLTQVTPGQNGSSTVVESVTYDANGVELSRTPVSDTITTQPVTQVTKIGVSDFNLNSDIWEGTESGIICLLAEYDTGADGCIDMPSSKNFSAVMINGVAYVFCISNYSVDTTNCLTPSDAWIVNVQPVIAIQNNNTFTYMGITYKADPRLGGGEPEQLTESICSEYGLACGRW